MNPYLSAKLGARKERLGSAHQCEDETEGYSAGAIDLWHYSMLSTFLVALSAR
jgi:hypothetical protein